MPPLTPQEIISLHRSGFTEPQSSGKAHTAVAALPPQAPTDDILLRLGSVDFSDEVLELDKDAEWAVVWQSAALEDFDKTGKINFLRITDAGFIILDVFKPGRHFSDEKFVGPEVALEIKAYLTKNTFTSWENLSSGWQDGADESTPDGIFSFHREKKMSDTHKLVWKGKHTNPIKAGMPFDVADTLEFEFV